MPRTRAKPPRTPFVVTAALAAATLVPACGGKVDSPGIGGGDAGPDARIERPEGCPLTKPTGGPCVGDLRCGYGNCFGSPNEFAVCKDGEWQPEIWSCNPPPPAPCPSYQPTAGSPCEASWPGRICSYPDLCKKEMAGTEDFECVDAKWVHKTRPYLAECPPVAPTHGTSCGECADHFPDSCNYKYCGMYPSIHARCDKKTKTWSVLESSCNPPPPDAGPPPPPPPSDAGSAEPSPPP